ncbi:endonuclease/exonuclease/phosphatase family protein [Rheinheimera sp. MMS21-TC3]|uniref:endonuclease/exonuclease/phosphatase family protein n=1 Tax=Rheinheimera sp. MMS21-TC3 TaxID=3072790 RepID=UPI0028C4E3E6|nr:endonuclease/exonuclease/phosphatase family protein [Rheinheimera sp. MMS21-TC3]WNO61521.1 endonuclease/exonuclease/phosphatase family protein [Rheinheimera sp. MMS21-TC3]
MVNAKQVTFATFNVSMEAQNYLPHGQNGDATVLAKLLQSGSEPQIKNIAHIVQIVRPDVLLLNEFDYIADSEKGVKAFIRNYLNKAQGDAAAIDYPYFYYNTVNTGQPSPFDLDNDGVASGTGADAWGFGFYPGQYGMVLLSKYPIDTSAVRTFQHFKWKDMPDFMPTTKADGSPWYSKAAWQKFPLSSKSHWDIPLTIAGETVRVLMSHPTPPAFDGPEKRNANRNHDEIRFWLDYISENKADYIYDDNGKKGGLEEAVRFVIMGDQNASADKEGNALHCAICNLVNHDKVNNSLAPKSKGGAEHSPDNPVATFHTAAWRMRADYVLPSKFGFSVKESGVFWPAKDEANYHLVGSRNASSDHRLVWLKLALNQD